MQTLLAQASVLLQRHHLSPQRRPHSPFLRSLSMWCPKTHHILPRRCHRDRSLHQCTRHLHRLLCSLRSTIRDWTQHSLLDTSPHLLRGHFHSTFRRRSYPQVLRARYARPIKWKITRTTSPRRSASESQSSLADNTIPSKTGSTCMRCVFVPQSLSERISAFEI
jgi:hypothetical protein